MAAVVDLSDGVEGDDDQRPRGSGMYMFGISREELAGISRTWHDEGNKVAGTEWTNFYSIGLGSDVLAAIRDSAGPAQNAAASIGNRLTTLAEKVDAFAANVCAQDATVGGEIYELPER
jgi:hypothetical protein